MDKIRITEIVKEEIVNLTNMDPIEILNELELKSDPILFDDLDMVEFTMALENRFEISIPDETAVSFITVNDVLNYLYAQVL